MNLFLTNGIIFLLLVLTSCAASKSNIQKQELVTLQIVDRNGLHETFSQKEKLDKYEQLDFLKPQPYQKVLRLYQNKNAGQPLGKLTSYHENGSIFQYLELVGGRACGKYQQWHPNGELYMDAQVVEGQGDLSAFAIQTFIFNGVCKVFSETGGLLAEFVYDKGLLEKEALYYFNSGTLSKKESYKNGKREGLCQEFDERGRIIKEAFYANDLLEGDLLFFGDEKRPSYREHYKEGLLIEAQYRDFKEELVSSVENGNGIISIYKDKTLFMQKEIRQGIVSGSVIVYYPNGAIENSYSWIEGQKEGVESVYYPSKKGEEKIKLSIPWHLGEISGVVKSYYISGSIESQKAMEQNQKEGVHIAWYQEGSIMMVEEYHQGKLIEGKYFKKGDREIVSRVVSGKGIATLFDAEGWSCRKVEYENGAPL